MLRSLTWVVGWGIVVIGLGAEASWAQERPQQPPSVLPNKPDDFGNRPLLGEMFSSKAAGIEFRAPANSIEVRKAGIPDLIVEFLDEPNQIALKVSTVELRESRKLEDFQDASGRKAPGLLKEVTEAFEKQNPVAEKLRQEVIHTKTGYEVGFIAYRYPQGKTRKLMQQAYIPVDDRYYYSLLYTSPGVKLNIDGEVDPREKMAADTFGELLDTVKLIDRTEIAKDQQQRIIRSRELIEKLRGPEKMNKALVPERWMRLTRDGKDIGYSYVVEERAKEDGRDGVLISIRSRTIPGSDAQVDVVSRMFISDGWTHESWSHEVTSRQGKQTNESSELGLADFQEHFKVDPPKDLLANPGAAKKNADPDVKDVSRWKLQVRSRMGEMVAQPFERILPTTYLPQALLQLLPRILPTREPAALILLTYVSDNRQVMLRYVDIGKAAEVEFNGTRVNAIAIQDRVGLEGVPTTYYVTPEGAYLGSETTYKVEGKRTVIRVLPSDEATLMKLWNVKPEKPQASDVPRIPQPRK